MGERIRAFDWASHPMGEPQQWPGALRMAISLCLNSSFPTAVYWGPQLWILYNDAWSVIPAERHPTLLGLPARAAWSDIWHVVGPQFDDVLRSGQGIALYDQMLPMVRDGHVAETWWNYSFTPIRRSDHSIGGIFNQGNEITEGVQTQRAREAEIGRWRETFHQAPAAVALLRGPQHVFEFANEDYLRLIGNRDIVGKPVAEALPEIAEQGFPKLLDSVYASGEPYLGKNTPVKLQRRAGEPAEDVVLDFIYQPVRDSASRVDGIFVLVTDVTDRARAEAALRRTNWQLGEERARLAALIEAERRAQQALRRFNETLEGHVRQRTVELTRALEKENADIQRLRATFDTALIFQAYLDAEGTLLEANPLSLAAIRAHPGQVLGRRYWETPWFSATPGAPETMREAVQAVRAGREVQTVLGLLLPAGRRDYRFHLRPVFDAARRVIGIVPEAVEVPPAAD